MNARALAFALMGAAFFAGIAQADISEAFDSGTCPEQTVARWCSSQLRKEGWALKYQAGSPQNLADAYWRYEVWMRERAAVLCLLVGGRGGVTANRCQALDEVR
jgi:hypothetical protein